MKNTRVKPYTWARDADGSQNYWTTDWMLFHIERLSDERWRLNYWNDAGKEIGIYESLKEAKHAAEDYIPDCI